ncbi:MAG: hypothetical protein NT109_03870 [Flavobacteriia bacterium]|nr:hypothetical protein [Flavobacteriia bacterium]
MKKIEKSFDDLKKIFANEELAEKLISKKYIFDLHKKKIESITIEENIIRCTYSPDSRYSFKLIFERNTNNQIDFSLTNSSVILIIIVGGLLGLRFINEFGWIGILIGVGVFYLATKILLAFVKDGIVERMNKRWDEVNNL